MFDDVAMAMLGVAGAAQRDMTTVDEMIGDPVQLVGDVAHLLTDHALQPTLVGHLDMQPTAYRQERYAILISYPEGTCQRRAFDDRECVLILGSKERILDPDIH